MIILIFYLNPLFKAALPQPSRGSAFMIGVIVTLSMAVQVLYRVY
jgi:hypothetical protein